MTLLLSTHYHIPNLLLNLIPKLSNSDFSRISLFANCAFAYSLIKRYNIRRQSYHTAIDTTFDYGLYGFSYFSIGVICAVFPSLRFPILALETINLVLECKN